MAPEQFVTGQSSVQSDIWALGIILYELVSGRHPFARPDGDEFQSIRAIQYANPPFRFQRVLRRGPSGAGERDLPLPGKNPQERYSSRPTCARR
jgi:serine/threonine protein kinase